AEVGIKHEHQLRHDVFLGHKWMEPSAGATVSSIQRIGWSNAMLGQFHSQKRIKVATVDHAICLDAHTSLIGTKDSIGQKVYHRSAQHNSRVKRIVYSEKIMAHWSADVEWKRRIYRCKIIAKVFHYRICLVTGD